MLYEVGQTVIEKTDQDRDVIVTKIQDNVITVSSGNTYDVYGLKYPKKGPYRSIRALKYRSR